MKEKRIVLSKTPLRITFTGGGTDIPSYYKEHGPGAVVSAAVSHYIYVASGINFYPDEIRVAYSKTENALKSIDEIQHPTVREAMRLLTVKSGVQLVSITEIPSRGTGLGSSSSFLVGVLNTLHTRKGEKISPRQLAEEACLIEREILREPGGRQDQYIAAYGGIKYMEFAKDGKVSLKDIHIDYNDMKDLERHIMLFYTGKERSSTKIHVTQAKGTEDHIESYDRMRDAAKETALAMEKGDMEQIGALLHENWELKKTLANGISNPMIDRWYGAARKHGALGGKIIGAGGGGFLMVFAPQKRHAEIAKALNGGLRQVPLTFELEGSKIVYVDE